MSQDAKSRIKYAIFFTSWNPKTHTPDQLVNDGERILPSDFAEHMSGHIYCPGCFTGLTRSPKNKPFFANKRAACFAHLPSNREVVCDLRSTKPEGMKYSDQEEAARAVENNELVLVHSFMDARPISPESSGTYNQTPVEDAQGPLSNIPIARHSGKEFRLPTRVTTVASICKNLDRNLYRYYVFPGGSAALRLLDALKCVASVSQETDRPALYFGKIIKSFNAGKTPKPQNIRMTRLHCHSDVKDFYIKVIDELQSEKGISDSTVGRHIIFWGKIESSGIGLCAQRLKWGEFALVPEKYDRILDDLG